jgi:hypothetical protein
VYKVNTPFYSNSREWDFYLRFWRNLHPFFAAFAPRGPLLPRRLHQGKVLNDGQLHYQHVWSPKDMDFLDHVICHYFILVSTICKSFCPSVHRFVSDLEFSQTLSFFHLLEAVLLEADGIDVDEAS